MIVNNVAALDLASLSLACDDHRNSGAARAVDSYLTVWSSTERWTQFPFVRPCSSEITGIKFPRLSW